MKSMMITAMASAVLLCALLPANAWASQYTDVLAIYPVVVSGSYVDVQQVLGEAYINWSEERKNYSGVLGMPTLRVASLSGDGRLHLLQLVGQPLHNPLHAWAIQNALSEQYDLPFPLPDTFVRDPWGQFSMRFPVLVYEAGMDETLIIFMLADGRAEKLPEPKLYIHASRFLLVNSVDSAAARRLMNAESTRNEAVESEWLCQYRFSVATGVTHKGEEVRRRLFAGWGRLSCSDSPQMLADYFTEMLAPFSRHERYGHAESTTPFFPEQEYWFTPTDGNEAFEISTRPSDMWYRSMKMSEVTEKVATWETAYFWLFNTLYGDNVMLIFEGADE